MMLGEVLSWERLDRLEKNDEVILDGACGSGIFLVEAYKRLVLHWRYNNDWKRPGQPCLRNFSHRACGAWIWKKAQSNYPRSASALHSVMH